MDKDKLVSVMYLNGDTQFMLAEALGITRTTLSAKINGRASFTQPEISSIKKRYHLTAEQIEDIFFTDNVSKQDTKSAP